MRHSSYTRTMKTACGKTITYFQSESGAICKAHSLEGPAIIYPKEEGKSPEYYVFGIKYNKAQWQELVNQHKAVVPTDLTRFDNHS